MTELVDYDGSFYFGERVVSRMAKYEYWLTPEGLLRIEGWAREGLTDEQISHNIGITRETLNQWKNRFSDISDTLKRGKDVVDREVENALFKRAVGYEYDEVTVDACNLESALIDILKDLQIANFKYKLMYKVVMRFE